MKVLAYLVGLLYVSICFGQSDSIGTNSPLKKGANTIDTTYIKDITDKLIIKINRDSRVDSFTITEKDKSSTTVLPNDRKNYYISVDYKFIGFSLGLPKSWSESDYQNYLKGKTTDFNLNFTFFFNKWLQAVYYNTIKGYYIDSSDLIIQNPSEVPRPYPQLPNFKTRRIGGSTSYVLNGNRFSYRSFLQQTQIQKKSSGSLIPSLSYEYFYSTDKNDDYLDESYKKNLSFTASIGYQYNWVVFKNMNFSGGISSGYGLGYVKSYEPIMTAEKQYWEQKITLNFNVNLNYQWKNLFCGIQVSSLNNFIKEEELSINNAINYENIYLGYRFNAPRIIKKPVTWLEKKLF
jgi:hypothetical protein